VTGPGGRKGVLSAGKGVILVRKKILLLICALSAFCFFTGSSLLAGQEDLAKKVSLLLNQLSSTSPPAQQAQAKNTLVKLGSGVLPLLEKAIETDKRTYVRVQIAFVLGQIGERSSIPVLERTARSQYFALNKSCVIALGGLPAQGGLEALKRLKAGNSDRNLVKVIEEQLQKKSKNKK
jgi:hypothetical protein